MNCSACLIYITFQIISLKKALVAFLKQNFKSGANQNSKTSFLKKILSDHALTTGIGVFGKLMCYITSCQAMTKVP